MERRDSGVLVQKIRIQDSAAFIREIARATRVLPLIAPHSCSLAELAAREWGPHQRHPLAGCHPPALPD